MTSTQRDSRPEEHDDQVSEEQHGQELRARAEAGDPQAQRDLGCAYIWGPNSGWGDIPRDRALARHWYVLAAEQGNTDAMWDVADMLLDGDGGPPDVERGLRYLHFLASRRRFVFWGEGAAEALVCAYAFGHYGLAPDQARAEHWRQRMFAHRRYRRGERRKSKRRG